MNPIKPKSIFLIQSGQCDPVYAAPERAEIAALTDLNPTVFTRETLAAAPAVLGETEIIFSTWGMAKLDAAFLDAAPRLRAVFYGAGSVRGFVTDEVWRRNVVIITAGAANAEPVAEYAVSTILLSLKHFWHHSREMHRLQKHPPRRAVPGAYRTTVGLVSLGMVGRRVAALLRNFEMRVLAYDPFVTPTDAAALGVELCGLDELFQRSHVVSLHAPNLPETREMITAQQLSLLPAEATFLNTARGAVVREADLIAVLQQRPDLTAVLDVTFPEPPAPGSPLYTLPNVVLTPHIAGSMDGECARMGRYMVDELRRYLAGEPLRWRVTPEIFARMA